MRGAPIAFVALAAIAVTSVAPPAAGAQGVQPEARVDAIVAHRSAVQAALGADIAFAPDLHLELAAGAGPAFGGGAGAAFSARGDAVVHFLLDPRHQMHWSPYAGGGIGARYDRATAWRAVAIVVVGVNAPRWKHAIPFIEAGLGGGFRMGAGLRRAR